MSWELKAFCWQVLIFFCDDERLSAKFSWNSIRKHDISYSLNCHWRGKKCNSFVCHKFLSIFIQTSKQQQSQHWRRRRLTFWILFHSGFRQKSKKKNEISDVVGSRRREKYSSPARFIIFFIFFRIQWMQIGVDILCYFSMAVIRFTIIICSFFEISDERRLRGCNADRTREWWTRGWQSIFNVKLNFDHPDPTTSSSSTARKFDFNMGKKLRGWVNN